MLAKEEWDFSNLEAKDLLECCDYEYEREIPNGFFNAPSPFGPWADTKQLKIPALFQRRLAAGCLVLGFGEQKPSKTVVLEMKLGVAEAKLTSEHGAASIMLYLDFHRKTDRELAAEFAVLISELRGKLLKYGSQFACRRKRGALKENDLRMRLRGLGLLRLRHAMPFDEVLQTLDGHPYGQIVARGARPFVIRQKLEQLRQQTLRWYRGYLTSDDPVAQYPMSWEPHPIC